MEYYVAGAVGLLCVVCLCVMAFYFGWYCGYEDGCEMKQTFEEIDRIKRGKH